MPAPVIITVAHAQAVAEWLIAEQKYLGQRTANTVADAWFDNVARLEDCTRWLLAEAQHHHRETAGKAATAIVDARVAKASLATIRARVSRAEREGLLAHRGVWPAEVIDATALAMQGLPDGADIELGGHARWVAARVLDAAARALHHDHVHVAVHSAEHTIDLLDKSGFYPPKPEAI